MNNENNKRRWFVFDDTVFKTRLLLFIGRRSEMCDTADEGIEALGNRIGNDVREDFKSVLRARFSEEDRNVNGECLSVSNGKGLKVYIVRIDKFEGSVEDTAVLSHECLHAALSILGYLGISENDPFECLCYLHEAILEEFMKCAFGSIGMLRKDEPSEEERKANEESFRQVKSDCEGKGV